MNGGSAVQPIVELRNIRKTFGRTVAIADLSLAIEAGSFVALLGPSGSGKTTCLRIIAGIIEPDGGRLDIAGRDVSSTPIHRRNVGMVFQNYSLFPHLDVAQNIAYPLRVRGIGGAEADRRVKAALDLIRLPGIGAKRPEELSGGQQQRVALARALVFDPSVLLLDEPLSALDRLLREEMQLELRRLHRETGKTMICVTHDRSEALTMADRIIVMRDGAIVQDAPPREIYERSNSRFVAEFLGETNVVPLRFREDGGTIAFDVAGRPVDLAGCPGPRSGAIDLVQRVEGVGLAGRDATATPTWAGEITEAMFQGDSVRFTVACPPHVLVVRVPIAQARGLQLGAPVAVDLLAASPMVFAAT